LKKGEILASNEPLRYPASGLKSAVSGVTVNYKPASSSV